MSIRRYLPAASVYLLAVGGVFLLIFAASADSKGNLRVQRKFVELRQALLDVEHVLRSGANPNDQEFIDALEHVDSSFQPIRANPYFRYSSAPVSALAELSQALARLRDTASSHPEDFSQNVVDALTAAHWSINELALVVGERAHVTNTSFRNSLLAGLALALLLPVGAFLQHNRTLRLERERNRAREEISLRKSVAHTERAALACDIHDGPAQVITRAVFELDGLLSADTEPEQTQSLTAVREHVQNGLDDLRRVMNNLRISEISAAEMPKELSDLVAHAEKFYGIPCRFTASGTWPGELGAEFNYHFYTIAREAVNNAGKHSHASVCRVELTCEADYVQVDIRDDGIGMGQLFDTTNSQGDGLVPEAVKSADRYGIRGMRERARLASIQLRWAAGPDGGTVVTVRALRRT